MADFDFKTQADENAIAAGAILFGADSHSAATPLNYPAALIRNYTPRGTGAINRTFEGKAQRTVDVFDFIDEDEWAAIEAYTSTTDLTVYIQRAITYVNSIKGALVFGPGRFCIGSLIGMDGMTGVTIQGAGGRDMTYSGTVGTVICFTGTGSGDIFTLTNYKGVWLRDIQVVYTSNSFTGLFFNCNTTTSTGSGCGFVNVQCYQITNNAHTALVCWYLRNNVDVYFENCYVSHATYGWIGLFDGDTGETNVICMVHCTSIGLTAAAIVNPVIGWTCFGCNFEIGDAGVAAGIINTGSKSVLNMGLFGCIFADATAASGSWIALNNVFNFTMSGGGLVAEIPSGTKVGASFSGAFCAGIVFQGVLFGTLNIGVEINCASTGVIIEGCNFLAVTTPLSGRSNCDAGSRFVGNNPDFGSYLDNTALRVADTDASHYLTIAPGSNLSANRTLTLTTGDANRTLTMTADSSIGGAAYVVGGTDIPVTDGGTGLSAGTSGGVPYFSSTTTIASSGALTADALVKGGGAGAAPVASGVLVDGSNNVTGIAQVTAVNAILTQDRAIRLNNQTSAAAAAAGTLANAPAAGNPTFWLKINIGGTNYAIPCWPG